MARITKTPKPRSDSLTLTTRQEKFVRGIIAGKTNTQAAIDAKCPPNSAASQATKWLKIPKIAEAVRAARVRVTEKAELTAAAVLAEIQKLAFVDITQAFNEDGSMKDFKDLPEDVRKALVGIEMIELFAGRGSKRAKIGHVRKFKSADKVRSLELLAKHFKLLTDVHEHTGKNGGPLVILTMPANGSEAPKPTPETKES